ncbi:MAG: formylmethanofuran dehydrogenase subunit E family protein [Desulfobacteraceae bacterium]|jgi:formylmethanofuran dehydrogenase subunit E
MNREEALRSIHEDLLEYIQKKVKVDYDNQKQRPASFLYHGKTHLIDEILGRFRLLESRSVNAFLVRVVGGDVYCLVFQPWDVNQRRVICKGFWVLSFRVLGDEEIMAFYREDRKLAVAEALKGVVEFHGRLCPDVVLGEKLCEYVQKLCSSSAESVGGLSIVAENGTAALDAIQLLLGATVGNRRLRIMDYGEHHYTFLCQSGHHGFRLSLRHQHKGSDVEYRALEQKFETHQSTMDEAVRFQALVDERVKHLMGLSPEALFGVEVLQTGCVDRSLH